MKRVLCIVGSMDAGGAESILMRIYRNLDKRNYQMDFAVTKDGFYDDEIKSYGGKIFFITPKTKGLFKNFFSIKKLVKKENYKYVFRASQHSLSALELLAAKLGGAENCIYSSSSSGTTSKSFKIRLLHHLFMFMPALFANTKVAPSTDAAEFMFGKNCIKSGKAEILQNAVDLNIYKYDVESRKQIRDEFGIHDKIVIGHVGRFNYLKNHKKLLEIFKSIKTIEPNAFLMLVGKGELEDEIKKQAKNLGIMDSIIFTGVRNDVPKLLSAMDVFVFPSLYEGMPNTVIEAQAGGLPCIISDTITKEADITNLVKFLSIELPAEEWAKEAINIIKSGRPNINDIKDAFIRAKYDIDSVNNKFIELVFGDISE